MEKREYIVRTYDSHGIDVIGDVHGCRDKLLELLGLLGYEQKDGRWSHPKHRHICFVGDFADRGPHDAETLLLVCNLIVRDGIAFSVLGNHDRRLRNYLNGRNVSFPYQFKRTVDAIHEKLTVEQIAALKDMLNSRPPYLVFNNELLVTHAGILGDGVFRQTNKHKLEAMCMYGKDTGEVNERGYKVIWKARQFWHGPEFQVYGHTKENLYPIVNEWTANVDTAPEFGGYLSAFRWPEREIVQTSKHDWDWEDMEMEKLMSLPTPLQVGDKRWRLPEKTLVISVGPSASGKSTVLNSSFPGTVVSTDQCRGELSATGDEGDQSVSGRAFDLFYTKIEKLMEQGTPVIAADSTALKPKYRNKLKNIAGKHDYSTVLLVFDVPLETCLHRQASRERKVPLDVMETQHGNLALSKEEIKKEAYNHVFFYEDGLQLFVGDNSGVGA